MNKQKLIKIMIGESEEAIKKSEKFLESEEELTMRAEIGYRFATRQSILVGGNKGSEIMVNANRRKDAVSNEIKNAKITIEANKKFIEFLNGIYEEKE